jgi:hypothetical protein
MRYRVVTTTAVGTSIWPIQLCEVNAQTAWMAETAAASVVRRSWVRAHLAVAGSSTGPQQRHTENLGAHRLQKRIPPDGGGRRGQREGGQLLQR